MGSGDVRLLAIKKNKEQLIEGIALTMFSSLGFHDTTIRKIADEAGISVGLIYNYYSSKEDLFKAVLIKGMNLIFSPLKNNLEISEKDIISFIDVFFLEMELYAKYWRLYFLVTCQPDIYSKFQKQLLAIKAPIISRFSSYYLNKGYPLPRLEAIFLFSIVEGICINFIANNEAFYPELLKNKLMDCLKLKE